MARLRNSESVARDSSARRMTSYSPSPALSHSSDKENHSQQTPKSSMPPPPLPNQQNAAPAAKRRRVDSRTLQEQTPASSRASTEDPGVQYYDPHQDIDERRKIRKGLRDLNKEAADLRTEWMAPDSNGLQDAISRANSIFQSVKQTSDATIDSRLLVTAGDLAYRKTQLVSMGDGSQGVDVDEFVSKCISFMRGADEVIEGESGLTSTQRNRRRLHSAMQADDESDDDDEDHLAGDALNWEYFGSHACFSVNFRPPVPGFLLGPLSVQKRVRANTQRRARMSRANPEDAVRPQELAHADLQQKENSNLTQICRKIHDTLGNTLFEGRQKVGEAEEENEDMSDLEVAELLEENNLADNGGVPLFKFAVNPKSFGQTVENLFYVSFLIKDGKVGVASDSKGLPTLDYVAAPQGGGEEGQQEQQRRNGSQRHQAVFSLDFDTWREIIDVFNIRDSIIAHRTEEEQNLAPTATGWYS